MKTIEIQIRKIFKNQKSKISYQTVQMVIFSGLKRNIKFINKRRRLSKKVFQKVLNFFYFKDFLFYKYICKMYILADI